MQKINDVLRPGIYTANGQKPIEILWITGPKENPNVRYGIGDTEDCMDLNSFRQLLKKYGYSREKDQCQK